MPAHRKDITGKRFGKLTALERLNLHAGKNYYWKCLCDCGNVVNVCRPNITSKEYPHCGCERKYTKRKTNPTMVNPILTKENV